MRGAMWIESFQQRRWQAWAGAMRERVGVPLRVELWDGRRIDFAAGPPRVTIRLPQPGALRYLMAPSLYSLGRAYVEGAIDVTGRAGDLMAVANALVRRGRLRPWHGLRGPPGWGAHTRSRDRAAIGYHYDVSNAFYAAWLDPAMVYSCAYFERGDESLADAQIAKIDHILRKIGLRPGQRLLDIGCGWGALVMHAARHYGARCVGITLSEQQAGLAQERVERAGLGRQIDIRLQDYRDVAGRFDRITSVGMFEHVGVDNLRPYFGKLRDLLSDDGVAMNHGLACTDVNGRAAPDGSGEFMREYVFPHSELAHLGTVLRAMEAAGLEARDVENLRRHYARTCQLWAENFDANTERIRQLTDERHYRIWRIYLAGCAWAFQHDWLSVYQVVCAKAGRDPAAIPWSRRYMYEGAATAWPGQDRGLT